MHPDSQPATSAPAPDPSPCQGLEPRLVAERLVDGRPTGAGQILPLPGPGVVVELLECASTGRLEVTVPATPAWAMARGCRVQVLPVPRRGPGGVRVLVIPPADRSVIVGGRLPGAPVVLLHEREALLWEPGPGSDAWALALTSFRRPLGWATAAQAARPCPVCRRPLGPGMIYRCACGAGLHHVPDPASRPDPLPGSGGEPGSGSGLGMGAGTGDPVPGRDADGCAALAGQCPVCQRPVDVAGVGLTWLPAGVDWDTGDAGDAGDAPPATVGEGRPA